MTGTTPHPAVTRLSVPTVRHKPLRDVTERELTYIRRAAQVLVPRTDQHQGAADVAEFRALVNEAVAIVDWEVQTVARLSEAQGELDGERLLAALETMSLIDADAFYRLSLIVAGVYLYADETLEAIGYPLPHRNAPPEDQVVDELMSGVLEPVLRRSGRRSPLD